MDRRAVGIAVVMGAPPGVGMGLALLSVTRGEATLAAGIVAIVAGTVLPLLIYLIASRGSVDDPSTGPDQLS